MSFWEFMLIVFAWLEARTTRILGVASGTLATLAGCSVIPDADMKYCMGAIAVLTYWRGSAITKTVSEARSIVAQAQAGSPMPPLVNPKETTG
jgi:hypothetical protein